MRNPATHNRSTRKIQGIFQPLVPIEIKTDRILAVGIIYSPSTIEVVLVAPYPDVYTFMIIISNSQAVSILGERIFEVQQPGKIIFGWYRTREAVVHTGFSH
jgi:hypothetical protein